MTESDAVVVHVRLAPEDWAAFHRHLGGIRAFRSIGIAWLLAWTFFALTVLLVPHWLGVDNRSMAAFVASLGIGMFPLILVLIYTRYLIDTAMNHAEGAFLRPHEIILSSAGVSFKSEVADLIYDWRAFLRIEETPTHLFLYYDRAMAYVVPKRAFGCAEDANRFEAMLRANIKRAQPLA